MYLFCFIFKLSGNLIIKTLHVYDREKLTCRYSSQFTLNKSMWSQYAEAKDGNVLPLFAARLRFSCMILVAVVTLRHIHTERQLWKQREAEKNEKFMFANLICLLDLRIQSKVAFGTKDCKRYRYIKSCNMNKWRHRKCTTRDGRCRSMRKLNLNSSEWRHTRTEKKISDTDGCTEKKRQIHPHFILLFSFYFIHFFLRFSALFQIIRCSSACVCVCARRDQPYDYCQTIQCIIILSHSCFMSDENKRGKVFHVVRVKFGAIFMFLIYLPVNCTHFRNFFTEYLRFFGMSFRFSVNVFCFSPFSPASLTLLFSFTRSARHFTFLSFRIPSASLLLYCSVIWQILFDAIRISVMKV